MCRLDLAHEFRGNRLGSVRRIIDNLQRQYDTKYDYLLINENAKKKISISSFKDAQIIYNYLNKNKDYRLRVQYKELTIYGTKKDWLLKLADDLSNTIEWWEPGPNLKVLKPGHVYLKNDNGHDFRVTIRGRLDQSAVNWLLNNQDKVKLGSVFLRSLERGSRYLDNMYFYIKNEKCLSLLNLVMSSNIRRVDKIIVLD